MNTIWKVDPNAVVLSWQKKESSKVIRNKASLPDSKKTAKPFFNGLFTSAGRSPYVRFILAHDEAPEKITRENVMIALEKADMSLTREPVQAKEVVKVGWLLGSHLGAFNHDVWLEVFSRPRSARAPGHVGARTRPIPWIHLGCFLWSDAHGNV